MTTWQRILWPLRSRKVHVAIATIAVAWAAQAGLEVSEAQVLAVLALGATIIGGITIEDAAEKRAGGAQVKKTK